MIGSYLRSFARRAVAAVVGLVALVSVASPGSATRYWDPPVFFPNASVTYSSQGGTAPYYSLSSDGTFFAPVTVVWNFSTETGKFYLHAETVPTSGSPCSFQKGPMHYAGLSSLTKYGYPGRGYDWYDVTTDGVRYIGDEFFDGDCNVYFDPVTDPKVSLPHYIDTGGATGGTVWSSNLAFSGYSEVYNSSGTKIVGRNYWTSYYQNRIDVAGGGSQLLKVTE